MSVKDLIQAKLAAIKPMEGVFPTAAEDPGTREQWRSVARSMHANEVKSAGDASRAALAHELSSSDVVESTVETFGGSRETREQVAGFAQAGVGLFHASTRYAGLPLAERSAAGGNGAVSRVMMEGSRILLEPQRMIVRFEKGVKAVQRRRVLEQHDLALIGSDGLPPDTYRVANMAGFATDKSAAVMADATVVFAEPDFIEHIGTRLTPADPLFTQQWHHNAIKCPAAWDTTAGEGIHIAVIDNGFDTAHSDLAFGSLSGWFRPTADFQDADFVSGIASMPDSDHGTACAGMIAASQGNGIGGCGVAFGSELSMIACLGDQVGTQSTLARAIAYAVRPSLEAGGGAGSGADIIACSLGPNTATWTIRQVLTDAIDFAASKGRKGKGTAIFWACTNGNFPISSDQVCSHPRVCAVGRSTSTDTDDGSGFGPELEFLAPGVQVLIPSSGNAYAATTGTSFAAPCAAGVAALALSQNRKLTATRLRNLLRATCDKIGALSYVNDRNPRFGYGRVNAQTAVSSASTFV